MTKTPTLNKFLWKWPLIWIGLTIPGILVVLAISAIYGVPSDPDAFLIDWAATPTPFKVILVIAVIPPAVTLPVWYVWKWLAIWRVGTWALWFVTVLLLSPFESGRRLLRIKSHPVLPIPAGTRLPSRRRAERLAAGAVMGAANRARSSSAGHGAKAGSDGGTTDRQRA